MKTILYPWRLLIISAWRFDRKASKVPASALLLFWAIFVLSACAGSGGGSSSGTTTADKSVVAAPTTSDGSGQTADPGTTTGGQDNASTPAVTPTSAPQDQTQTPTPTPTPAPSPTPSPTLYCYVNNGVFCTGGNLGAVVIEMSMSAIFTGGNSGIQVANTTVVNTAFANDHVVCANHNQAGCYSNSSCITATLVAGGNMYQQTSCGDIVMQGTKTFSDQ